MSKLYRNCSEIFVYNFFKIIETQNLIWLVVGYDGYDKVKYDVKQAKENWDNIFEEYFKLKGDNKTLLYLEIQSELLYLKARFQTASMLLGRLEKGVLNDELRIQFIEHLADWNYVINREKPLDNEIERMYRQLMASKNKINLKEQELKDLNIGGDKSNMSLIEQTIKLEQALGRNEINLKTTTLEKYIGLIKEVEEINRARKKKNGK